MLVYNNRFPTYADGNFTDCILMRFFPTEERMRCFLDGKLYMNPPTFFHDKNLGEGVYDRMEAATLMVDGASEQGMPKIEFGEKDGKPFFQVSILPPDQIPSDYKEPHFIYWPNGPKSQNVCCMYALWLNRNESTFGELNTKMLTEFGPFGIVIADKDAFLNAIGTALTAYPEISTAVCGFVHYIPEDECKGIIDWTPFHKRAEGYSHQNEFRLCFTKDSEGPIMFDLHRSLDGIALPIKTEEFINTLAYHKDDSISFEDMT